MTKPLSFSRRDFLKIATLGAFSLAIPPRLLQLAAGATCPPPPVVGTARARLTAAQQLRLAVVARTFIAPELDSARQVALDIDFIEGPNEDASTMCGPLAIAILQNADLLGPWAKPHDFWLLNPRVTLLPMEVTFPNDVYDWFTFDGPISTFDFSAFPLMAGDLVYLHAAPGDTFEHMLVVSRVDEDGQAYAVSNFFIASGTIIEERLLYDPRQAGVGQFANWGERSLRNQMGNTGTGGFRIWRVKDGRSLELPGDAANQRLRSDLDTLLLAAAGDWYASIRQLGGPLLYQFNPYAAFNPAATINVHIALGFFHWLETQRITDFAYLNEHGVGGRTFAQLLQAMLVDSEVDAAQDLMNFLGKGWLDDLWLSWGLEVTKSDPPRSSATELSAAFKSLFSGAWVSPQAGDLILGWLATYTFNDDTRLGLLRQRLPAQAVIYNRRGALTAWPRVVADSGLIQLPDGRVYSFSLHGVGKSNASFEELEATFHQAIATFGDFLISP